MPKKRIARASLAAEHGRSGELSGRALLVSETESTTGRAGRQERVPIYGPDGKRAEAEAMGVTQVVITDRESGQTYRATLVDLHAHGWEFDRGYGSQTAMRLTRWMTIGAPTSQTPAPERPAQPVAVQLAIFGA